MRQKNKRQKTNITTTTNTNKPPTHTPASTPDDEKGQNHATTPLKRPGQPRFIHDERHFTGDCHGRLV
jgi:hypothetical protein